MKNWWKSLDCYLFLSIDYSGDLRILEKSRLQNSPYFCVFKYARAVKQKVWNEHLRTGTSLKTESETGAGEIKIPQYSTYRFIFGLFLKLRKSTFQEKTI